MPEEKSDEQKQQQYWKELSEIWKGAASRIAKGAAEAGRAAMEASSATVKASSSEARDIGKDAAQLALKATQSAMRAMADFLEEVKEKKPSDLAHAARAAAATAVKEASPSKTLRPNSRPVLAELERLDDVVYDAIGGRTGAVEELETLWPKVLAELGDEMVAESREQYLRYALSIWEECSEPVEGRNPARAIQALDVLCILFDDA